MNEFKDLKYGDEFFSVENEKIVKYNFIHIDEKYGNNAFFTKEYDNETSFCPIYIEQFLKFFKNKIDAENKLKEDIFKKLYEYREFKNKNLKNYEIKDFEINDEIFLIFSDTLNIFNGFVLEIRMNDMNYGKFSFFDEYKMVYDLYGNGVGYLSDYGDNGLFFKKNEDAKSKVYEILCERLTNEYHLNLNGYKFKEEEIIWIIKDNGVIQKIMNKDEKYDGYGFFFEKHAKEVFDRE